MSPAHSAVPSRALPPLSFISLPQFRQALAFALPRP
jgi:hypothetical protein